MDVRNELFNKNNMLKSHVIIVISKGTLTARYSLTAAADSSTRKTGMSSAVAKSASKYLDRPPISFLAALNKHVSVVVINEGHNIRGFEVNVQIALRWLNALFYIVLTATPLLQGADKFSAILSILQDLDVEEEAAKKLRRNLMSDPYAKDLLSNYVNCKYRATCSAFDAFYNRDASIVEQGRILGIVLRKVILRRTY